MINPDGVFRGYFRHDTNGVNLNRLYINPNHSEAPAIYGIKELVMRYYNEDKNRIYSYIDLHAHGTKRGCFFYGNALDF
jgi:murein tripeptide amidase MpaA